MTTRNLDLRRFASDVGINFLRVSLMTVMGIGISILLARGLGTEGKGLYELAIFLPTVLQAVLNTGSQLFTVYYVGKGKYDITAAARGNLALTLWVSLLGIAVGLALLLPGAELLFPGVPRHLLFISLGMLPFLYARPSLSAIFQGLQEFPAFSAIELIPYIVNLIVLLLMIWWFPDREVAALLAILSGNLASVVYAIYLLWKRSEDQRRLFTWRVDRHYLRDVLDYGLKAQFGLIMLFLLFRVDVYLINQIGGGAVSVGIYSIAVVLAERIWVFTGFAAQVMMPRIASWEGENEKRTELTLLTMRYTLWLSFIIAAGALLLGRWLINLLYGEAFTPGVIPLFLIMPGIITYNFSRVLSSDFSARGKPEINAALFTFGLVANVIANLILIPRFDYAGAAIASTLSYSLLGLTTLILFSGMNHVSWTKAIFPEREDLHRIRQTLVGTIGWLSRRFHTISSTS